MEGNTIPKWTLYAPLLAGGAYFSYGHFYKKETLGKSALWSILVTIAACLPWLYYHRQNTMPAISSSTSTGDKKESPADSDINLMNKAGRQQAVDYIIQQEAKLHDGVMYKTAPPALVSDSYKTLTNNELKALYLIYKFMEHKADLAQYGTISDDGLAKKIAKEKFDVNADDIPSIKETARVAMTKVGKPQLTV